MATTCTLGLAIAAAVTAFSFSDALSFRPLCGALALFLSAVGLYGMIAFLVTRQTRDIGLRIALGSPPMRVASAFVGRGMRAVAVGLAAGTGGAWVLSNLLSTWLAGVAPHDVTAFAVAVGSVLVVSVIACAIPAHRGARVDRTVALRME